MAAEIPQLPHLTIIHRMCDIPMVGYALEKSASTYKRVRTWHGLVHWAFSTAEISITHATKQAAPIALPIARTLRAPINYFDDTLCVGLDKIEKTIPIIKEKPEQVETCVFYFLMS